MKVKLKTLFRFSAFEIKTLFIFAHGYGIITVQGYEIGNKIEYKPISKF